MTRDCSTCIYKEGSCYPSLTIFDKDKTCKSYRPDYEGYIADLEKCNTELKEKLEKETNHRIQNFNKTIKWKEKHRALKKENEKIFNDWLEACDKYGKVSLKQQKNKERLEKAKTFLKEFCAYRMYDCDATRKDYETFEELKEQAEQFLEEIKEND